MTRSSRDLIAADGARVVYGSGKALGVGVIRSAPEDELEFGSVGSGSRPHRDQLGAPTPRRWARFVGQGSDCLVILNHFDDAIGFQRSQPSGRPILVKLGMPPEVGARLVQVSATAAFMIEFGSLLGALSVVALSLPVIVPVVSRRAARRQVRSAGQLVELGRGDAIKRLKIDLGALRDRLRATEGDLAVAREAERALAHNESELARLTSALDERSLLADWQKAEIAALTMQVQALNDLLTQAGEETEAVEGRCDAAVHALSEKESELARLAIALNERSELADSGESQIAALTAQIQALNERLTQAGEETRAVEERHNAAVRALSEKESELARVTNALDERSALADSQKDEIALLTIQVRTLKEELSQAHEGTTATEDRRDAALRALSSKESELATLTNAFEERSVLVDSQKVENAALRMQVRALNERLIQAGKEARALEECCDVELAEQSRLLNESESELAHLRREIEIARRAEDDLRVAIIEIDGRANAAIQNLNAEKSQLQAALDRANGERARFVHELAGMKRRQAEESRPAERLDNATRASTTSLPKGPGVRPIADYHEERSAAAPASSPCRRIAPC
jgi:chromosome segregation ATPase